MHRKSLFISPLTLLPPPSLGLPFGLLFPLVISLCCLTLIWTIPCFLITACPMPVPCKHSSRCGGKCKASGGKSRGWERAQSRQKPRQKSRLRQHQDTFVTTAKCQQSLPPIPHFLREIRHPKEPNCGSDHILECPVRLAELLSTNLFPSGFSEDLDVRGAWGHLHTCLLFTFKSGSVSEDLSHFQMLFILIYNGFLKVKQCVSNTVLILTAFLTSLWPFLLSVLCQFNPCKGFRENSKWHDLYEN